MNRAPFTLPEPLDIMPKADREHPRLVLGIGGLMRHGKDAVADVLESAHGFHRLAMSDALHRALMTLDPIIGTDVLTQPVRYSDHVGRMGFIEAKRHPEVRRLQRYLGTEVVRNQLDPNAWVSAALRSIEEHPDQSVAVTGIRYPNELEMIRSRTHYGVSVWVTRPNMPEPDTSHTSETSLTESDFDVVIHNTGTLEDIAKWSKHILFACERYAIADRRPLQLHVDTRTGVMGYEHWVPTAIADRLRER